MYVVEHEAYLRLWGVEPDRDPAKRSVAIDRVESLRESPFRLPAHLATELYDAGESGMGTCVFTVEFTDGTRRAYHTGNAVDFVPPPAGLTLADARRVHPHEGRDDAPARGLDYVWCLCAGLPEASAG